MYLQMAKKGQSILEYAILLGIIISAVLIMQTFVKRGFQGGLKESADKMGDQFSAGGTTTYRERTIEGTQTITQQSGTTTGETGIGSIVQDGGLRDIVSAGVYSATERSGGESTTTSKSQTDSAKAEKFKWDEYEAKSVSDYSVPDVE